MASGRGTVTMTGNKFMNASRRVSPSPKARLTPKPPFGPSSQFKGIGRGVRGDPRK